VGAIGRVWSARRTADQILGSGLLVDLVGLPGACFLGDSGEYAQKHDPFLYYDDIRTNPTECARIVPGRRRSAASLAGRRTRSP
jgi:hypothetical protein